MTVVSYSSQESIDTTNDNIVIKKMLEDILGGKALDVTDWPHTTIPGGHPIILGTSGAYHPIPLQEDEVTIDDTDAASTVGYLAGTILTSRPEASIMVRGTINPNAAKYTIPDGCKTATPLVRFEAD